MAKILTAKPIISALGYTLYPSVRHRFPQKALCEPRARLMDCAGGAQDPIEARSNVEKRLEFITAELERLDSQLKAHQDKQSRREQQARALRPLEPVCRSLACDGT